MKLVLFCHPDFMGSQSMPRFARSLATGFAARGHEVELRAPGPHLHRWFVRHASAAKWAGYVDQYLLFPREIRRRLRDDAPETLYVFCDQALGPWVPCVLNRPHVVHCHDLLALRSALGLVPENPTSLTGRIYQRYIRRGFRRARHFISVSARSRSELHEFGGVQPLSSEVVHNGLNFPYTRLGTAAADAALARAGLQAAPRGMLLHVSGGQWYKNVPGLLHLYGHYVRQTSDPLPLWLVGVHLNAAIRAALAALPPGAHVLQLHGLDNDTLQAVYSRSRALLFPSLAEGFGWPIVEAQACGCPVITTDEAPMNEVGGPHTRYLPRLRSDDDVQVWAERGAAVLGALLDLPGPERERLAATGVEWASRFDPDKAIDRYLALYEQVLIRERQHAAPARKPLPSLPTKSPDE